MYKHPPVSELGYLAYQVLTTGGMVEWFCLSGWCFLWRKFVVCALYFFIVRLRSKAGFFVFFFLVCVSMASIFVWDDAWDLMLRFVVIPGASRQGHWATTLQEFEINLEDNDCTATNIAEMMVNSGNYPHM